MPQHSYPETERDCSAWSRLWEAARAPWDRTDDLAHVLGVTRQAVGQWCSGARGGPWPALRAALRQTARRHPEAVPALVRTLALELLDASGTWVPEGAAVVADDRDEAGDVGVALGELRVAPHTHRPLGFAVTTAVLSLASPAEVQRLADALVREAREAAHAAAAEAK